MQARYRVYFFLLFQQNMTESTYYLHMCGICASVNYIYISQIGIRKIADHNINISTNNLKKIYN